VTRDRSITVTVAEVQGGAGTTDGWRVIEVVDCTLL
jgi:hypothetical protein